mmetsp:Transcript_6376/g.9986  ORF Transcript_6376/g.9986 Transcript_6376/m.9986 type:complete len:562 (+) Transcript_6376:106-1791(+)
MMERLMETKTGSYGAPLPRNDWKDAEELSVSEAEVDEPPPPSEKTTDMAQAEATSPGQNMIKYIKSNDDWVTLMNEDKLVVTNFTASGWASCSFVASFFEAMPKDYPNVIFAIVDLDKKDEIKAPFDVDINVLPIFQFYKRGEKLQELAGAGASVDKLRADIAALDLDEAFEEEKYEEESGSVKLLSDSVEDPKPYRLQGYSRSALPRQNFGRTKKKSALPHRKDRTFNVLQKGVGNKKNHARAGNKKNSIQSLTEEYLRLSLQFESALIQHKLALQYYEFRSYYFVFLPVTLIATLITIIGFLISGTTQDDDNDGTAQAQGFADEFDPLLTGQSKQIWSLVVGILGAIATLLNSIGKRTNYQSQSDMHRSAVKALEKICLTVAFEKEWFDRNVYDFEYSDSGESKKLVESLGADLKTHQASFKAMLDACCDSPVPEEVVQAFTLLEQVFHLHPFDNDGRFSDLSPLMFHYHKLWKEYSTYRLWPLKAPSIQVSKKYQEWKREMGESYNDAGDDPVMGRRVLEYLSRDLRNDTLQVNQDAVQFDAPFVGDNLEATRRRHTR